jgi:hypothetical protein
VEFKALLAMGYLFDGQYEKTRAILQENPDLKVGPRQTFPQAVLEDLRRLRDKGLTHPDLDKLEKLLATHADNASE